MENLTRLSLLSLRLALENDERYLALQKSEKELENNAEVAFLSQKMKSAMEEYAYAKDHFGQENPLTKQKQKAFHEAKKALDEHPASQDYLKRYIPVRDLYFRLDEILLSPYKNRRNCMERKS